MRNGMPFSNARVTLSDPTMPELYSTDGGLVSRNLTLANTMDADSGTYTCVASNGNAVTPSDTQDFELFVNGKLNMCNNIPVYFSIPYVWFVCHSRTTKPYFISSSAVAPTILEPPENLTVVQPQSATFLCNATARPRPQITWWRMGSQLMAQTNTIEISSDNFGEREMVSNLTIVMADPSDTGEYVCQATNAAGQDTATAELTVHGKSQIFIRENSDSRLLSVLLQSYRTSPSLWKIISYTL